MASYTPFDPRDGAVLAINREGGQILRLTYSNTQIGVPLPGTLADTGTFSDLTTLTPHPGIVPYDLNVPFWSDNARKTRWFSLPNVNQTITFSRDGNWQFPTGTVWIKHFELEMTNGVPESARRLETRLLVRTAFGIYGVTYRWGDSKTNAILVDENGIDETFEIHDGGTVRNQVWRYPSRSECLTCHTPIAGHALGFNTAQLNREHDYGSLRLNQIAALNQAGYFFTNITGFHTFPALATAGNIAVSLDYRVRSYLAANCIQCHQPGGAARATFDTRLGTPLSESGMINGLLVDPLDDDENRVVKPGDLAHSVLFTRIADLGPRHMPPLATSVLNSEAIELLRAWIATAGQTGADETVTLSGTIAGSQLQLRFTRPANRAVEIQWAEDLSGVSAWKALDLPGNEPLFPATKAEALIVDPIATQTSRYYRALIRRP